MPIRTNRDLFGVRTNSTSSGTRTLITGCGYRMVLMDRYSIDVKVNGYSHAQVLYHNWQNQPLLGEGAAMDHLTDKRHCDVRSDRTVRL
jgi:hypothetical protein